MTFLEKIPTSDRPFSHKSFHEFLEEVAWEVDIAFATPGEEGEKRVSQVAKNFFERLQAGLKSFNGADGDLYSLVKRLKPHKPHELSIEPLLSEMVEDCFDQNQRLKVECSKKVVPYGSLVAGFQLPLLDATDECVKRTCRFTSRGDTNFSLPELLEMCSFLEAQTLNEKATFLFNFHVISHLIENPQEFASELLNYEEKARMIFPPDIANTNTCHLKNLFKNSILNAIQGVSLSISSDLFRWMQYDEPGEEELFQGYEQFFLNDFPKAFEFFSQAAVKNYPFAFAKLGDCYKNGVGVPQDGTKALEYYSKAAKLKNSHGFIGMAECYWSGLGVSNNYQEAFKYYKEAATLGDSWGLCAMANCFYHGKGAPKDEKKAFTYYRDAAELGCPLALMGLGTCYYKGQGVSQDNEEAFKYWMMAKKLRLDKAALNVACFLIWHRKTPESREEAKTILLDLISRKVPRAQQLYDEHFSGLKK